MIEGYIQALIDSHYRRLTKLNDNQRLIQHYEINFIEELESLKEFLEKERAMEVDK